MFVKDIMLSALLSPNFMPYERLVIERVSYGAVSYEYFMYTNVDEELRKFFSREYLYDVQSIKELIVQSMLRGKEWTELSREPVQVLKPVPYGTEELAKAIPPPPGDIVATRYGVAGEKPMRVDACIPPGESALNTIVVSSEDGIWQTIELEWLSPLRSDDQSDSSQSCFSLQDLNYDGEPALRIVSDSPSNNEFYFFWLWDVESERFIRCAALDILNGIQK